MEIVTDKLKEHSSRILRSLYLPFLDITAEMKLRSLKKEGKFWCMRVHLRAWSKSDKLAQTMSERDIGSCYVTSCILLWCMDQIKIVWPATTNDSLLLHFDWERQILCVLALGSTVAERCFSCIKGRSTIGFETVCWRCT